MSMTRRVARAFQPANEVDWRPPEWEREKTREFFCLFIKFKSTEEEKDGKNRAMKRVYTVYHLSLQDRHDAGIQLLSKFNV